MRLDPRVLRTALLLTLIACKSNKASEPAPSPVPPPAAPVGPHVDPAGFERTCAAATDCVIVKPAICDPCACPGVAIASSAMATFDEATSKLACPAPDLMVKCQPCAPHVAACDQGTCVVAPST